jgi:hypothetical protein
MGTPSGSAGGFATPAVKGSLMLGKAKGRLRTGLEYGNMSGAAELSNTMILSREGSYDIGEGETGTSRVGGHQLVGRGAGEKSRIFAKSEEITVALHEGLPPDVIKAMGIDGEFFEFGPGLVLINRIQMLGVRRILEDTILLLGIPGWLQVVIRGFGNTT